MSVPKLYQQLAADHPDKPVFYYANDVWTFQQLENYSNKIANYFIQLGFKHGDEVALFMENRPEYVGIWLGLAKAGIVTALVNTNQRQLTLLHSLKVINSKAIVFCDRLAHAVREIVPELNGDMKFICYDSVASKTSQEPQNGQSSDSESFVYVNEFAFSSLNAALSAVSDEAPVERIQATNFTGEFCDALSLSVIDT